ncbi:serine/threonine protein kinase [Paenibacillus sp. y28]|uniref:serine/threonine protein kinase n=1 Tax=Paenibacillus sp. y28 TaxID=3129110 RepID=UPI00301B4380
MTEQEQYKTMTFRSEQEQLKPYILEVEEMLPQLELDGSRLHEPVQVKRLPKPWRVAGCGNYAGVFLHPDYPGFVVKVYAPGKPGWADEVEVYKRLGSHPAYSECYHARAGYLVLRRLSGMTLYNCIRKGVPIPQQVIRDIDKALAYAVSRGLSPHDVHGKNVMMKDGRGIVVDVSDFLEQDPCEMWEDLKKAYNRFYFPWLRRIPVPDKILNLVRKGYRAWRKWKRRFRQKYSH